MVESFNLGYFNYFGVVLFMENNIVVRKDKDFLLLFCEILFMLFLRFLCKILEYLVCEW